jgi:hypothetical protein
VKTSIMHSERNAKPLRKSTLSVTLLGAQHQSSGLCNLMVSNATRDSILRCSVFIDFKKSIQEVY